MAKPTMYNETDGVYLGPILKEAVKIPRTAANHRSKVSRSTATLYEGPSFDIDQRDIDRAAKKYHKEMKNRLREFKSGQEEIEMEPGFVPVQKQPANHQLETCPDVRSRPRLSSRLKSLKHQRLRKQSQERGLRKAHRELVVPANDSILGNVRQNRQIRSLEATSNNSQEFGHQSEFSEGKGLRQRQIRISGPQRSQVGPREEQSPRRQSYELPSTHNNRESIDSTEHRGLTIGRLNEISRKHEPTRLQTDPHLSVERSNRKREQHENREERSPMEMNHIVSLTETLQKRSTRLAEAYSGFRFREGSQAQHNNTPSSMSAVRNSEVAGQSNQREQDRINIEASIMLTDAKPHLHDNQRHLRDRERQIRPRISQTDPELRSHNRENRMHSTRTNLRGHSVQSDTSRQLHTTESHRPNYPREEVQNENITELSHVYPKVTSRSSGRNSQQQGLHETMLAVENLHLHSVQGHSRIVQQQSPSESSVRLTETYPGFRYREGRQSQLNSAHNLAASQFHLNEGTVSQDTEEGPLQDSSLIFHDEVSVQHPPSTNIDIQSQVIHNNGHRQGSPRISLPYNRVLIRQAEEPNEGPLTPEDQPPSDEYYAGNEAEIPPYHATLHKYLDLISYDPRVVPCLRVNRSLIKSNDKLSESIFQFLKFNLFPESIDPWEISHIDDQHYDDLIPDLIPVDTDSDVLPNLPSEPHYRHHGNIVPHMVSDDDYEYALYLSTLENNVHNYSPSFRSPM